MKVGSAPATIQIGIGINTGSVATDIVGTLELMDACGFGSTVNLVARCEGLTKEVGASLIITEHTYDLLEYKSQCTVTRLGETTICGMERRVDLYEVARTSHRLDRICETGKGQAGSRLAFFIRMREAR